MKKMSKVLSLLLVLSVLLTTFVFAAYPGDANDTAPYKRYVSQYAELGQSGISTKPWNISELNTSEWVQKANEKIWSTDPNTGAYKYTSYTIYIEGKPEIYTSPLVLDGLHGRPDTPIVIAYDYSGSAGKISVSGEEPAIIIKDCSNIEIRDVEIEAPNGAGIFVYGTDTICENITLKNININGIQYTDYTPAEPETPVEETETAAKTFAEPTAAVLMGEAVKIDNNTKNINLNNIIISKCNKGIGVYNSDESATTNISNVNIINCGISSVNREAINLMNTDGVTISGGYASDASTAAAATDEQNYYSVAAISAFKDTNLLITGVEISKNPDAAISLSEVTNTTVEKVYSHNNASFMDNYLQGDANLRIRYCISGHDNLEASNILSGDVKNAYVYNNTFVDANELNFSDAKDSVIKNNLFSMMIMRKVVIGQGNSLSNNIYHNTFINLNDLKSKIKHPQFAYETQVNVGDYIPATSSPLLGKGVQVEENMGTTDIYGNSLAEVTTHNIGAYEGPGIEAIDKINVNSSNFSSMIAALDYWFGDTFRTIFNKLVPATVQDQLAKAFGKVIEFVTNLIMKN